MRIFYNGQFGGGDPQSEGIPCNVTGLQICTGAVVSVVSSERAATFLFKTNKQAIVAFNNQPPGISTAGIYILP